MTSSECLFGEQVGEDVVHVASSVFMTPSTPRPDRTNWCGRSPISDCTRDGSVARAGDERHVTIGTVLRSRLDTRSDDYRSNLAAMQALWDTVAAEMASVPTIGGQRYVDRHHARDKMLVRERIERLVDPNTALLELQSARRVGHAGRRRGRHRQRDRRRREHAGGDQRHRHDLPRRIGEPDELAQAATLLRDRQGEPAPADPAQRVRRRRSAPPGRPVHPGRGQLPRSHADVEDGHPDHHRRVRAEHRRRRVHAGDERLHRVRQGSRHGLSRRAAAREDGDRRDRRRGDPRWGRDALAARAGCPTTSPPTRLDGLRIARQIVRHLRWKRLGPGADRTARRSRCTTLPS